MGSDRSFCQTAGAIFGKILATCFLLAACAPSMPIGPVRTAPQEAQTCPDGSATDTPSIPSVYTSSERGTSLHNTIERHEKIGIGTGVSFGLPRMLRDVDLIRAGWFYTWQSALPRLSVEGWYVGDDVMLERARGNSRVVFGSSGAAAWITQTAQVEAGRSYDLFVRASGPASARAGLAVKFMDDAGMLLGEHSIELSGATGAAVLPDIVAPLGSTTAQIVGWLSAGHGLALDDIMMVGDGVDVVQNGGFEISEYFTGDRHDFVPMIWGPDDVTAENLSHAARAGVVLGFNEPDHLEQANMSVLEAVELWPELMAIGARLGSPATTMHETLGPDSWLSRFMAEADATGLRVDFIAVHYYSADQDVDAFRNFLKEVHTAYGRPIWVTEWGLHDWSDHDRFGFPETAAFFRDGTLMMDELDFVERHAWFGAYDGFDGFRGNTHLFDGAGDLTPVGDAFADLARHCERIGLHDGRISHGPHWRRSLL